MRLFVLVFSLLFFGSMIHVSAQSTKKRFPKSLAQKQQMVESARFTGFAGKKGMLPDSIESFDYNPFEKEYSEFPISTRHFTYDQDGNVVEIIVDQPPYNSNRYTYLYINGKQIEEIRYDWNPSTFSWVPTNKEQIFSNQFGVDTAEINSFYDTTNRLWIEADRSITSIEYDNQNRPIVKIDKEYDALTQTWTYDERVLYVYSGSDTLPSELYFAYWNNGVWSNAFWMNRVEWGLGFRPDFEDEEITLTMMSVALNGNWTAYFYDSSVIVDGKVVDYYSYSYESTSAKYELSYSEHHSFDVHGNEIKSVNIEWENGVSDTTYTEWNDIVYGFNGEVIEWVNRFITKVSGTEYRSKDIYYYGITSLVLVEKQVGVIYPNPLSASQKLFILSEEPVQKIHMYSFDGALLRIWNEMDEQGIDIQGFAAGIYFIRLEDREGNVTTQRLQIR